MSTHAGRSFPEVLAQLLTQAPLRQWFAQDPVACAAGLGLDQQVQQQIAALDAGSLERQAQSLIDKRRLEVGALLPATFARVGHTLPWHFAAHAAGSWPTGEHRHVLDALAFARYLREQGLPLCRRELNFLQFQLRGRSWKQPLALHAVYCRVRGGHMRPALQLLYFWRGQFREHLLYLF